MIYVEYRVPSHSNILEVSRRNMVGKTKVQSPERYNKRLYYHAKGFDIDFKDLIDKDFLVANVSVGNYICTIAYKGVIDNLVDLVRRLPKHYSNLQAVIRALNKSIDETDILVNCTCPDFKYRFAYWATEHGYKYGSPENRKSNITNPGDKLGATCKHLSLLLSNKKWLVKLASVLNKFIRDNANEIRDKYGLSDNEFIVNPLGFQKRVNNVNNVNSSNNELEPTEGNRYGTTN